MSIVENIKKQRAYRRTVNALRSLPPHVAEDVGIVPADIEKVARRNVWGD